MPEPHLFTYRHLAAFSRVMLILAVALACSSKSAAQYALLYQTNGTAVTLTGHSGIPVNVVIPNFVTSIGPDAFVGCPTLASVTISNSVTNIGLYAFASCPLLTNVTIGSGVIYIDGYAFMDCSSLVSISVNTQNPNYSSTNGILMSKNQTTLVAYPGGRVGSYTVPNNINYIEGGAFYGCTHLSSIVLGNDIPTISAVTFYGCNSLTNITVSSQNSELNSINGVVFDDNSYEVAAYPPGLIGSYTISNGVQYIGEDAFAYCNNLTSISIPSSVFLVGEGAFTGCSSLDTVNCPLIINNRLGYTVSYGTPFGGNVLVGSVFTLGDPTFDPPDASPAGNLSVAVDCTIEDSNVGLVGIPITGSFSVNVPIVNLDVIGTNYTATWGQWIYYPQIASTFFPIVPYPYPSFATILNIQKGDPLFVTFAGSTNPSPYSPPGNYQIPFSVTDSNGGYLLQSYNVTYVNAPATLTLLPPVANPPNTNLPPNDNFAHRITLIGSNPSTNGNNFNATMEAGEPYPAAVAGPWGNQIAGVTNSVWWSWTAPSNGLVRVNTQASDFETFIDVYTGTTLSNLSLVASNLSAVATVCPESLSNQLSFYAKAGTNYQICISGFAQGNIRLSVEPLVIQVLSLHITNSQFTAEVGIENSGAAPAGPALRLAVMAQSGYSEQTIGQITTNPPDQTLQIVTLTNPPTVAPGTTNQVSISGTFPANIGDSNSYAFGWGVFLLLQQEIGTNWVTLDEDLLSYDSWPSLGDFNGPGGGVDRNNPPGYSSQAPKVLSVGIIPNTFSTYDNVNVNCYGSVQFDTGMDATFTNASWTTSLFSVTANGILQVQPVLQNTNVTVTGYYNYNGMIYSASTNIQVRVPNNPEIVFQPANQEAGLGDTRSFGIVATGIIPLSYQWYYDGSKIPNATNSSFSVSNLQLSDSGSFSIIVSNQYGAITSSIATLEVFDTEPPSVYITQPASIYVTNAAFTLTGTATDAAGISKVAVTNNGMPEVVIGTNSWSSELDLSPGSNVIVVTSYNLSSVPSLPATMTITLRPAPDVGDLTLLTNGNGVIQRVNLPKNPIIGKRYAVTAEPTPGNVFSNWEGGLVAPYPEYSSLPALSFLMQSNLVLIANFVTNPFPAFVGTYNGLFEDTNGFSVESAGMLRNLAVGNLGQYSGSLVIAGTSCPLNGRFSASGQAVERVYRSQSSGGPLSVSMGLTFSSNSIAQISGSVMGTNSGVLWTANLFAVLAGSTLPAAQYTASIMPDTNNMPFIITPGGDGYATITENAGKARVAGALADGVSYSATTSISRDGTMPLYVSLYKRKGLVLGWLNVTNTNSSVLTWLHPQLNSGVFTHSFVSTNPVFISPWSDSGVPAEMTNMEIIDPLSASILTNDFALSFENSSKFSAAGETTNVTGSLSPKSGLITLSIGSGASKETGHGVLLLNRTNAAGYIVTKTNGQEFHITP